jgi:hypothetical protein
MVWFVPLLSRPSFVPTPVVPSWDDARDADYVSLESAYGALLTGGTVALHEGLWTDRPGDERADRPGFPN